jgi:hypothetical protein
VIGDIFEVVWVGLLAGVGITAAYSFVVLGSGQYADARRAGHSGLGWAAMALLAFVLFIAAVAYGVHIMLSK